MTTATRGGTAFDTPVDAAVARAVASEVARRRRAALGRRALSLATPPLLLLVWEVLVRIGMLDHRFFSRPSDVFVTFANMLADGTLLTNVAVTLQRVVVGFTAGAAVALVVGTLMGLSPWVRAALNPLVAALYPIPKIALFPLVLIIFGLGETSKIIIIAIGVFFPVLVNTLLGVLSIPRIFFEVADNFGATGYRFYRSIVAPGALPAIFSGIKLGAGMSLLVIVAAEFVGSADGLGALIWSAWQTYQIDRMYAGLVTISLLGYAILTALDEIERFVIPWRQN